MIFVKVSVVTFQKYLLNLIDTPGHVDFSYEVSRSLNACQGAILLVDANQGIQAQTVANFYLAFTNDLTIIPVLNKIDLKTANPEAVKEQMFSLFEIDPDEVLQVRFRNEFDDSLKQFSVLVMWSNELFQVSAKLGKGVTEVLDAVVKSVPSPAVKCNIDSPLRVLLFDSWFDRYRVQ